MNEKESTVVQFVPHLAKQKVSKNSHTIVSYGEKWKSYMPSTETELLYNKIQRLIRNR